MTRTITVEGDLATVDSLTRLTTQGSVSAPSLVVPKGSKKIDKIYVAIAADHAAAGRAAFFIRLGGNAVKNGEQTIVVSAGGVALPQAGSDQAPAGIMATIIDDADIDVADGDTLTISAEMAGQDLGTAGAAVTLLFA